MAIEKRDLVMEAHLQAIAIWYWIAAAACVLLAGGLVLFFKESLPADAQRMMKAGIVMGILGAVTSYALGSYLMKYSEGARITAGIMSGLTLLMNIAAVARPGGALSQGNWGRLVSTTLAAGWCVVLLWAFFNGRSSIVCSEEYRVIVKATPDQKPETFRSPFFWVPFILVGVSMTVATIYWVTHKAG